MTSETARSRAQQPAKVAAGRKLESTGIDAAWLRFRDELDARLVARYGLALAAHDGEHADPEILADLALQRALMP